MQYRLGILMAVCLLVMSAGTSRAEEIVISAAASLTRVMQAEAAAFSKYSPQDRVLFNFGASGSLVQQMRHGAPADLFVSASRRFMDRAVSLGLVDRAAPRLFAHNQMVLAVPVDRSGAVHTLLDIRSRSVRYVAVGNPKTVPAGRYARESLEAAGLWGPLLGKYVLANSVRQVVDYLRRSEVDAGVVYATDLVSSAKSIVPVQRLDPVSSIDYLIAITHQGGRAAAGRRFMAFLTGPEGGRILQDHGFLLPLAPTEEAADGH